LSFGRRSVRQADLQARPDQSIAALASTRRGRFKSTRFASIARRLAPSIAVAREVAATVLVRQPLVCEPHRGPGRQRKPIARLGLAPRRAAPAADAVAEAPSLRAQWRIAPPGEIDRLRRLRAASANEYPAGTLRDARRR